MKSFSPIKSAVALACGSLVFTFLLLPGPVSATNTLTAFGLTFEAGAGASLTFDEYSGLYVWRGEAGAPPVYDFAGGSSALDEPGNFGVRVVLGEAQHGVFGYPSAWFEDEYFDMGGRAYGSVNGLTNQLISTVHSWRQSWAEYSIEVDLSGLGCSQLVFSLFRGEERIYEITNGAPSGTVLADFGSTWNSVPRVNPYWRMPCGDLGVLVEFDQQAYVSSPGWNPEADPDAFEGDYGNRIFVRALNPSNTVEFVSHAEVTATTNLPYFTLTDCRLGMFGHSHKALGDATMDARGGKLTFTNISDLPSTTEVETGVAIELNDATAFMNFGWVELLEGAGLFEMNLDPVELSAEGAWLKLNSMGMEHRGEDLIEGDVLGTVRLEYFEGGLHLEAQLCSDSVLWSVYNQGQLAGSSLQPVSLVASVQEGPRVIGCAVHANSMSSAASYTFRFDRPATFYLGVSSEGKTNLLTGDEVRLGAVSTLGGATNAVAIASFQTFITYAHSIRSFSITGESLAPALLEIPALTIERFQTNVVISWPDPNRAFYLESAPTTEGPFWWVESPVNWANNIASVTLGVGTENRIFRLNAHQVRRPRPGVD